MPEGPECRITVDFLNKNLQSNIINKWIFCGGKYTDEYPSGYKIFDKFLPATVVEINCKGKFIYFTLKNNNKYMYVLHSLMLTGNWQNQYDNNSKCFIELENNETIWYSDPRGFGTFSFTEKFTDIEDKLNKLGPDIMSPQFTLHEFKKIIKLHSNLNITAFLMKQEIISGCGNYIKAEVLFYSKISPLRKISSLKSSEVELLFEGLVIIPRLSYNNRLLALESETDELNFRNLKVYGNNNVTKTKTADGRITYWDSSVQK